jgi:prepilin-type N-terminal cleavage/methylation domain-containing protein
VTPLSARKAGTFDFRPPASETSSSLACHTFTLPRPRERSAFTLLELLVVIGIIGLLLTFSIPNIGTSSGRSLEGSTRQFLADLENARLMAIVERTRTRILIAVADVPTWGQDLALRGYLTVSFNRNSNSWTQRGKWNRLSQSIAFDPNAGRGGSSFWIIASRRTATTSVAKVAGGTTADFTGAYIEFHPNGSTSLDPLSLPEAISIADAIVSSSGSFTAKNQKLRFQVTIDPLSGSMALQ